MTIRRQRASARVEGDDGEEICDDLHVWQATHEIECVF
jgi:hypothetical protein